jgi:hypothetical protein
MTARCDCPHSLELRSRGLAGAGRASGGWVLARQTSATDETCECCPGHTIRRGQVVHLVQALDGEILIVCVDCTGRGRGR